MNAIRLLLALCVALVMSAASAVAEPCQHEQHDGSTTESSRDPVPAPYPQVFPAVVTCDDGSDIECDNRWYEYVPAHLTPGECTDTGGEGKCCVDVELGIKAYEVKCDSDGECDIDTTKPVNLVGGSFQAAGGSHMAYRNIIVGATVDCVETEEGFCCP